jgi:hypothetical protein
MTRVILRIDDVCAQTDVVALQAICDPCWERGIPVCVSVIPQSAYRFGSEGPIPDAPTDILANAALVALLAAKRRAGLVEIALHGWQHHYGELAQGPTVEIGARIGMGLDLLRRAWPVAPIRVVVPPHDYLSRTGWHAIRGLDLGICSSWAATHGGGRRAHWRGRFRRWRGIPFGVAQDARWPTDIDLLDFAGPEADDWPATGRLLVRAQRAHTSIVFVQHYWRLLCADCAPNARFDRWRRWLDQITALPDVRFERYSDE